MKTRTATAKKQRAMTLPNVDRQIVGAFAQAEAMLKSSDRGAHAKYKGLQCLDEFADIMFAMGTAMFQLGVEHGARRK